MAEFDVVAAVSRTLEERLTAGLLELGGATPPRAQVHDLVEEPATDPATLTLFLYDIVQDPSVRNRPASTRVVNGRHRRLKQPLGLILYYMITAWGGTRETELLMLGRAMQVLYDDAIIDGPELAGTLAGTDVQLKVSMAPLYLEDRARVWFAIQRTYRLSVNYEVRVVDIDARTDEPSGIVRERELRTGIPAVP